MLEIYSILIDNNCIDFVFFKRSTNQALTDEGKDPNEYVFESDEKPKSPVKRPRNESRSSNANETQVFKIGPIFYLEFA